MNPTSSPTHGRRTLLLIAGGALLVAFGWIVSGETLEAQSGRAATAGERAAVIQGQPITEAELEAAAAEQLEELDIQRQAMEAQFAYQRQVTLHQAMESLIEERLLALEAEAKGVSVDELLAQEATGEPVTEAEIDAFYQNLASQRQGVPPKEQIADQIKSYLEQQRPAEARQAFVDSLEAKYQVERLRGEPTLPIETAGFPAKGPADAPVTLVEFSDFQCPFCSRVNPALEHVREKFGDKVRVVFRHFPLHSIHPQAQKAAEASLCAEDQGKFWEYHDLLFAEQEKLAVADLKSKAGQLGLDQEAFDECLDSGRHAEAVETDLRAGRLIGVTGTPALFINGKKVEGGAIPPEQLAELVQKELDQID